MASRTYPCVARRADDDPLSGDAKPEEVMFWILLGCEQ